MTDPRTTPIAGVHYARLVESPVETSAPDRRFDFVPAPKPRAVVMRPTTNTQYIATSAIDLRDDVLRDEVPSIVVDACHGILGGERDAIVQAIEQEDTRPLRRFAAGTTPPSAGGEAIDDGSALTADGPRTADAGEGLRTAVVGHGLRTAGHGLRTAVERRDVAAIRDALDAVDTDVAGPDDDVLALTLARGSSPALDGAVALARRPSLSLDGAVALARRPSSSLDGAVALAPSPSLDGAVLARGSSSSLDEAAANVLGAKPTGGRSR